MPLSAVALTYVGAPFLYISTRRAENRGIWNAIIAALVAVNTALLGYGIHVDGTEPKWEPIVSILVELIMVFLLLLTHIIYPSNSKIV